MIQKHMVGILYAKPMILLCAFITVLCKLIIMGDKHILFQFSYFTCGLKTMLYLQTHETWMEEAPLLSLLTNLTNLSTEAVHESVPKMRSPWLYMNKKNS